MASAIRSLAAALAVVGFLTSVWSAESDPTPLSLHPDNPHYFQWRGRPTVLVTSGEHYGAVLNLDFDYVTYLDELQRRGLNHTRTFSGVYRENRDAFNITDNTLAPAPGRYICPWARSDQPGYNVSGNRFDLDRWDEAYFARLKDFLSEAAERGVVVELTLFCPMYRQQMWDDCPMNASNNVNGVGNVPRDEVYTLKHGDLLKIQLDVTRKIVRELRGFDNLYYEVCNEPYFGGVTMDWQHAIVDTIVETEKEFEHQHLISLNVANGSEKVRDPHPAVSIFNFHYCVPPTAVDVNYGLNKVIGENETGFRGSHDVLYRTEGWDFLIAGGGLYNNLDYSFTTSHPAGTLREYESPGGGSPELREQLGILRRFLEGFEFIEMRPDDSVIRGVSPELTTGALVNPGVEYAIYLHVPLPKKPDNLSRLLRDGVTAELTVDLPPGRYDVKWIDTKTGEAAGGKMLNHDGGELKLGSPEFANDIALAIRRTDAR